MLSQEQRRAGNDLPPEPKENPIQTVNRLMAERHGQIVLMADLAEALEAAEESGFGSTQAFIRIF